MSLFRKPRSPFWWYDFTVRGQRYRASTGERTKSAAGTVESAALVALQGGTPPPRSAKCPTLREFADRFTAWFTTAHTLKPATRRYYTFGLRLLTFSRLWDVPLDKITSELVECTAFRRPVIDRRTDLPTGAWVDCGPAYTNQALRTLKVLLGKAHKWKLVPEREVFATMQVAGRDRLIDVDTEISLQHELQTPERHGGVRRNRERAWLITVILQDTGMRPGEVYPLRIENVHLNQARIWVPGGKTSNARRWVPMSERMVEMLRDWIGDRREGWVFPSKSASGHIESVRSSFRGARDRAGIDPNVVPYSARHTYATYQMEATGNMFAVSASMGHAGVASMKPYQHPSTAALNASIDKRNRAREERRIELLLESGHTPRHTTGLVN